MNKIIDDLNKEQKEAVLHPGGPLLVLAGAGSGKTRVISRKIAYLINHEGIKPWEILSVTFTNKAAREMKERVEELLGDHVKLQWMGTFHSICAKMLRIERPFTGKSSDFTILDSGDQLSIVKECLAELKVDEKKYKPRSLLSVISAAKNRLKTVSDFAETARKHFQKLAAEVYHLYQEKLESANSMDFDDLIMKTVFLLRDNAEIRKKYQEKFKQILIDEYQDVNFAQYSLAKILSQVHKNICVVGDDDQAIYGFRGADVSIILKFEKDYPGAKVIKLEKNYRSTKIILDAANAVVSHNKSRKKKKLYSGEGMGERLGSKACTDGRQEARYVAGEINRWTEKGMKFKDMAVLYRTNAQSRSIEEVLKQEGIDYTIVGGLRFYERAEIKDAVAYLKFIRNPKDEHSFKRIINVPSRGIGSVTRNKIILTARKTNQTILQVMKDASSLSRIGKKIQETLSHFAADIEKLHDEMEKISISDFVDLVLKTHGYYDMLKSTNDPKDYERLENLEELINDAKEFEMTAEDRSLDAFLEKIALFTDIDEKEDPGEDADGKVTLMTVHSAKGLEFPVVFVAGLEEGLFPHFRSIEEGKESAIEEERRLFYVAMTRAQKKLYLTYSKERTIHGKTSNRSPSRFLVEVPEELVDHHMPELSQRSFTRKVAPILKRHRSSERKTRNKFSKGDEVYHKIFGKGVVVDSEKGYVTANFDAVGKKTLSQKFLTAYGKDGNPVTKDKISINPGDKVIVRGFANGIVKKVEGKSVYVIMSNGEVEKFTRDTVKLKRK